MLPRRCRATTLVAMLCLGGCTTREQGRISAEIALLGRQEKGLTALIASAESGSVVPAADILAIVDQRLVEALLRGTTPFEQVLGDKYRIRINDASVLFEDGFALVRLDGQAGFARGRERISAQVSVFCGLDIVELDTVSGTLRGRVQVFAVESPRVDVLGHDAPARRLVEELGREKLETFAALASTLEVPVRLEREVTIPGVGPGGGVRISPVRLPLRVGVREVKALLGKLFVAIDASAGSWASQEP